MGGWLGPKADLEVRPLLGTEQRFVCCQALSLVTVPTTLFRLVCACACACVWLHRCNIITGGGGHQVYVPAGLLASIPIAQMLDELQGRCSMVAKINRSALACIRTSYVTFCFFGRTYIPCSWAI